MIEAMACGTPVIAWRNGSVPEVVDEGVTGFVVDSIAQAVEAVARVAGLSRRACRAAFERRFDAARMARSYVEVYRRVAGAGLESHRLKPGTDWTPPGPRPAAPHSFAAPPV